jgi:signal peptidase I
MAVQKKKKKDKEEESGPPIDSKRETIESVAMAIILAFMFRTFIVEAFVIPTGSMATTLQGRHMDVDCPQCGYRYQSGASGENADADSYVSVVATTCPICRYTMELDKVADSNQKSFTGDRILVNKFSYAFRDPERWQVVVFRFPGNPKQPYIKRLIGLPGESIRIVGGDIHVDDKIARKPDNRLLSMLQLVHDTNHRPAVFDEIRWPHRWQPWSRDRKAKAGWDMLDGSRGYQNSGASRSDSYLRYNHIVAPEIWSEIQLLEDFRSAGQQEQLEKQLANLRQVAQDYSVGELVADYYAYNDRLTDWNKSHKEGIHWVGDLAGEYEVEVQGNTGTLLLDLVEGGVHYQCQVDVANGKATLRIDHGRGVFTAADGSQQKELSGETDLVGPGSYDLRFSNVDNEIRLWVDNDRIDFHVPATYLADELRTPHWTAEDPLDAAPLGIGSRQLAMTVHRLRVYRDIYYIAARPRDRNEYEGYTDFEARDRLAAYKKWNNEPMFQRRRTLEFKLSKDEFFPLGDNSPQSKDARLWISDPLKELRRSEVVIKLGVRIAEGTGPPRIAQLMPFGGAYVTDIRPGDVITSIDGIPIGSREALRDVMDLRFVESEIALELDRDGVTIQRTVTLGLRPSFHRDLLVGEALMIYWPHPWRVGSLPIIPHFRRMGLIR